MTESINLHRVLWSPVASQRLTGFDSSGVYTTTDIVFSAGRDLYRGIEGTFYRVVSWMPDGRGYGDKK